MDNENETQLTDIRKTVEKWRNDVYVHFDGMQMRYFAAIEIMAYQRVLDLIDGKVNQDD